MRWAAWVREKESVMQDPSLEPEGTCPIEPRSPAKLPVLPVKLSSNSRLQGVCADPVVDATPDLDYSALESLLATYLTQPDHFLTIRKWHDSTALLTANLMCSDRGRVRKTATVKCAVVIDFRPACFSLHGNRVINFRNTVLEA